MLTATYVTDMNGVGRHTYNTTRNMVITATTIISLHLELPLAPRRMYTYMQQETTDRQKLTTPRRTAMEVYG